MGTFEGLAAAAGAFNEARALNRLARQQKQEASLINPVRPTLRRSVGGLERENMFRNLTGSIADPSYYLGEQAIGESQAQALSSIGRTGSASDIIGAAGSLQANTLRAKMANLQAANQRQMANRQGLDSALSDAAQEEYNLFMFNEIDPYTEAYLKKQNLLDARTRNLAGSRKALTAGLTNLGRVADEKKQEATQAAMMMATMGTGAPAMGATSVGAGFGSQIPSSAFAGAPRSFAGSKPPRQSYYGEQADSQE